ncbi:leucine-rich repeat and calponin homology domain-containing protein isoform X2 [Sitodiplosis mosellana]|uniref:leucine-rich repeat and calponin homology domain-containing protein isoform X2 n=1 Tax=Sitodiplosis mosellana TaxID=263140 RepID=UPI00244412D8|nr:leucine-rich repeat and calponin homology domain-containing protein isoform X2 [Sitodiplosis mosellana]
MAGLMPKVFEEANLSGELRLSGRKLKDFPKTAAKYNLSDTVIADLSRNRLCELPEDVTGFPFLETLLMYHNSLRSIPESIRGLHSLSFLDLRSNLLTSLPRELCFLPIEVLLVSNNRLIALPDELGRMEQLTELDAACNQITHLPARMSDLKNLKSLSLRNNQLVYLPRDVTCLKLVSLDVSCNRIATLPVELRLMTDLVHLELSSNPLTSPPASLCVRGLVHVFKYLDTMAMKEEKTRNGTYDGNTTLRRKAAATLNSGPLTELQKIRRQNVDSGYSTSDGFDKRWSQELATSNGTPTAAAAATTVTDNGNASKWSPTQTKSVLSSEKQSPSTASYSQFQPQSSGNSTPTLSSPAGSNNNTLTSNQSNISDYIKPSDLADSTTPTRSLNGNNREYKEALRQQRNQDSHSIYRPKEPAKEQTSPVSAQESPSNATTTKSNTSTPTSTQIQNSSSSTASTNSPLSPRFAHNSSVKYVGPTTLNTNGSTVSNGSSESINSNVSNGTTPITSIKSPLRGDKPIQKVTPSRNSTPIKYNHQQVTSPTNGNVTIASKLNATTTKEYNAYIKPNSPAKPNTINCSNGSPAINLNSTPKTNGSNKSAGQKSPRSVSWNRDSPAEKLSFTMRREFDRQKEESELIEQLRKSIESRLKMTLPKDIGSALTDGVVLCHLANHVRPRSVGSIHVPSPAVPKLTMARCRRNVDNFLDACRKIGVDEELICSCADIVPTMTTTTTDGIQMSDATTLDNQIADECTTNTEHRASLDVSPPPNAAAMYRTVAALLAMAEIPSCFTGSAKQTHATNTTNTGNYSDGTVDEIDSYNQYFKQIGIHFQKSANRVLLLENQPENPSKSECHTIDGDHFNEYSSIDDIDCSASNANDQTMQCSSLCSSSASTNQPTYDHCLIEHAIELPNDCSSNINSISNSVINNNNLVEPNADCVDARSLPVQTRRKIPNTLNLIMSNTTILNASSTSTSPTGGVVTTKKRKMSNLKRTYKQMNNTKYSDRFALNGITEECEYDSDIGKFNCKIGTSDQLMSDTSSGSYEFSEETATIRTDSASSNEDQSLNDLNLTPKHRNHDTNHTIEWFNFNKSEKIVMKRIEFFENINNKTETKPKTDENLISSIICMASFIFAVLFLFFFPLAS